MKNENLEEYNLTEEIYDKMLLEQDFGCACCERTFACPQVDHDNDTLEMRGLLCSKCNVLTGQMKDNHVIFQTFVNYLTKGVYTRVFAKESVLGNPTSLLEI